MEEGGAHSIGCCEPSYDSCEAHQQPLSIYCYACKSLICRDCTLKDHFGHNYEFVRVAAPDVKKKLVQQLGNLRESTSNVSSNIHSTISEVKDQRQSTVERIEGSFLELQSIVDSRKQELLQEVDMKVMEKLQLLTKQEEDISALSLSLQCVMEYADQCLEHSTDSEIMRIHTDILSRMREIEEQQNYPIVKADLAGGRSELRREPEAALSKWSCDISGCRRYNERCHTC